MEDFDVDDNVKLGLTISRYDLRRLKMWATIHGRSPTAYAAQIISSRLEANFATINEQFADYAKSKGKTVEEVLVDLDLDPND